MHVEAKVNTGTNYLNRTTVYAALTIGARTWWIQRWDTDWSPRNRFRSRDGAMGWTAGTRYMYRDAVGDYHTVPLP